MRTSRLALAATLLMATASVQAQTTYTGQDEGTEAGEATPDSTAASTSFRAAAATYGPVTTVDFDTAATADVNSFSFPGLRITTTNPQIGNGLTGISDMSPSPTRLYGYDQSAGGAGKWLGFPVGTATFSFTAPTNSFGFFISGTQTTFGALLNVVIGGVTYQAPVNVDGGAGFFGYTSDTAFSTVDISHPGDDAWGIDNVSYNFTPTSTALPEPATWAMMIGGIGMVGGTMRRRRHATATFA